MSIEGIHGELMERSKELSQREVSEMLQKLIEAQDGASEDVVTALREAVEKLEILEGALMKGEPKPIN